MGDLIKIPHSELTATLELLDHYGVRQEHLTKLRKASTHAQRVTATALMRCGEALSEELSGASHVVDCSAIPFIPDGWSWTAKDQLSSPIWDVLTWNPTRVELHLSKEQKGSGFMPGRNLRKELGSELVLPANVLDYLLASPRLIPRNWNNKNVFFWGTIYRSSNDRLCVRCLCRGVDGWGWSYGFLTHHFGSNDPAVVLAS